MAAAMNLMIVESPAKCKKIQSYLGPNWHVVASMGHIRGLSQDINFLQNDFEPTYEYLKEKAKAIASLKAVCKKGVTVYLAADRDFEGEQIAYSVCLLLKQNPQVAKRVTFTEITKEAIQRAIENPTTIDMNRVHTQQARAMLDLLIGFTMSPLLWRYVAPSLSAGRCQIPSLRLVTEREDAIQAFKVSSSWTLSSQMVYKSTITPTVTPSVTPLVFTSVLEDELEDEESAVNYMENIHTIRSATIIQKVIKLWTESAPQPLITSTLQQQASALYGMNPKTTMQIAQRLYEAGHITYMRTDKAVLSEEAIIAAMKYVVENYGEAYVKEEKEEKKDKKDKTASAQEAHEAIRPTHMEVTDLADLDDLDSYEKKLYKLIWQRTIQSVMSAARGESCRIRLQLKDDKEADEFTWRSDWKRTTFEGWKCIGKVATIDDMDVNALTEEDTTDWSFVEQLKVGGIVQWSTITAQPKETKAHGRYTEATLIRELEKHGIGRPSTFASLLATIQEKNYIEVVDIPPRITTVKVYTVEPAIWPPLEAEQKKKVGAEKKKLVPTPLGRSVLSFMLTHFDDLFAYDFTKHMEQRLNMVAEGQEEWKQVIKDMWNTYAGRYNTLLLSKESKQSTTKNTMKKVKEFQGGLKAVQTKKGPLLLVEGKTPQDTKFLGWPQGITFEEITEEVAVGFQEKNTVNTQSIGEYNGYTIIKKTGKYGTYLQCNQVSIPFQEGEAIDSILERFKVKENGATNVLRQFPSYVIRQGQYGPYIMKLGLKKAKFVSFPKGLNPLNITEKEVEAIYKLPVAKSNKHIKE